MSPDLSHALSATLALGIAVAGTIAYSAGIALQHNSVGPQGGGVGLRSFLRLLKNRRWLGGLLLILVSAGCHLTALTMAPITLVQPVGILAIVWSVIIESRAGHRPDRVAVLACAAAVLGLGAFEVLATLNTASADHLTITPVAWTAGFIVVGALLLGLSGAFGPTRHKTLTWAASAAVLYGLATGFIKVGLTVLAQPRWWADPWLWVSVAALVAIYPVAAWIVTQSFAAGRASVAVGTMTTVDPVMATGFGLVALGEGVRIGVGEGVGMTVAAVVAIAAVMVLSVSEHAAISPEAAHDRE